MLKIKIKSGLESQQSNIHHYDDTNMYDEFGDYIGQQDQYGQGKASPSCIVCGGTITNSHLVFEIKSAEYELHTSCMITSMALVANGIRLLGGLFNRKSEKD